MKKPNGICEKHMKPTSDQQAPVQPPQQLRPEQCIQSAISALDFQDPKTAAQYLHVALELLA